MSPSAGFPLFLHLSIAQADTNRCQIAIMYIKLRHSRQTRSHKLRSQHQINDIAHSVNFKFCNNKRVRAFPISLDYALRLYSRLCTIQIVGQYAQRKIVALKWYIYIFNVYVHHRRWLWRWYVYNVYVRLCDNDIKTVSTTIADRQMRRVKMCNWRLCMAAHADT